MFVDLCRRPNMRIAKSGSLCILQYLGPSSLADADADFKHQQAVAAEHGHLSNLVLFDAKAVGKPDDAVKKRVSDQVRSLGPKLKGTALVVMGDGISTTIIRTMLVAVSLIAKSPQKVFSDVGAALEYLKALPGQSADVKALAVDEVARHLGLSLKKAA